MRLVSLFSNNDRVFPPVEFHAGINVVFARVQDPALKDRDSHNLGKTLLIEVIDFALLKTADKDHLFRRFNAVFGDFVFYLQLVTPQGQWVTIRRAVAGKKPCSLLVSDRQPDDLTNLSDGDWTYSDLSVRKACARLNSLLKLAVAEPYDYRKGLGYVLRRQSDWDEVFRLERFQRGRDKDWKPYMATLLGFDAELILKKYELEEQQNGLQQVLKVLEQEAGSRSSEYGKLQGLIELKQAAVTKQRQELNQFRFRDIEAEVSSLGVQGIEDEINRLNERRYTIDYEINEIERSLETRVPFDLDRIKQVFEEARLTFPDALYRSYDDLIEFNQRLTASRADRLEALRADLLRERGEIETTLARLDDERSKVLRVLQERETLKKYRLLQETIGHQEAEIAELERKLDKLDVAATIQRQIQDLQAEIAACADEIRNAVRHGNAELRKIRTLFADYVQRVLNVPALLSVSVNEAGNLEFDVQTLDRSIAERETSEAAGTSYRKVLCACFDLALLTAYSSDPFYRFVYHDGVLEGLDNRKKVNWLELAREVSAAHGLQYVLSVIDSDLPRDPRDNKLLFSPGELIRELHDEGDSGRLFRMPAF